MSRAPSTTWGRAVGFSAIVFFAPLAAAVVAVWALSPATSSAITLLVAGGSVAVLGTAWLAVVTRRRASSVPGLVLGAAGIGFGAAVLAGLLWAVVGGAGLGAGGVVFVGQVAVAVAAGVYLVAGGPAWVAAAALFASPLVLPEGRVDRRRTGIVLTIIGSVVSVGTILFVRLVSGREPLQRLCLESGAASGLGAEPAVPNGEFSWFPLGVRCAWPHDGYSSPSDPGWFATIVVVVALSLAALGWALIVRSRAPRPGPAAALIAADRWDAPDDPWRPTG